MMKNKYLFLWILAIVLFYLLNAISPGLRDDFTYKYMYKAPGYNFDYSHPIQNIADIVQSQIPHYLNWGGRAIVHILAQLFCGIIGKPIYDVLAAIIFGVWMIPFGRLCVSCKMDKVHSLPMAMSCTLVFWLFTGEPMVFYNGLTFGLNYLYTSMMCLWFAFFFIKIQKGTVSKKWYFLPFWGFFAAWGHEVYTIGTATLISIWALINFRKLTRIQFVSLFAFYIGSVFVVFAPGNFARNDVATINLFTVPEYLICQYKFWVCVFLVILAYWRKWQLLLSCCKDNVHFIGAWLISVFFVTVIGQTSNRALVGVDLFGFLLIVRLLTYQGISCNVYKYSSFLSVGLSALLCIVIYYQKPASEEYARLYKTCEEHRGKSLFFTFKHLETPSWMVDKFIGYRYHWCSVFWDKEYGKAYCCDLHISEEDAHTFTKTGLKVPGDNPFYQVGNYYYTAQRLSSTVKVNVDYGNYKPFNVLLLCKRLLVSFLFKSKQHKSLVMDYNMQDISISSHQKVQRYYIGNDNTGREVRRVDLLNQ